MKIVSRRDFWYFIGSSGIAILALGLSVVWSGNDRYHDLAQLVAWLGAAFLIVGVVGLFLFGRSGADDSWKVLDTGGGDLNGPVQQNLGSVRRDMIGVQNNYNVTPASGDQRPRFTVSISGSDRNEHQFSPEWKVRHAGGDLPDALEWRFRTSYSPSASWRQVQLDAIERTNFISEPQDVSGSVIQGFDLEPDQAVFELRFHWNGNWHRDGHRYPMTRTTTPSARVNIDLGNEIMPVAREIKA